MRYKSKSEADVRIWLREPLWIAALAITRQLGNARSI